MTGCCSDQRHPRKPAARSPPRTRPRPARTSPATISEGHGVSIIAREGDTVYHCYSSYTRGTEFLMGYYAILDRDAEGPRRGRSAHGDWLRRHDEYHNQ